MTRKLAYLRVYIGHLREKLEQDPAAPELLLTEQPKGYRLAMQPS
jgi:two-component system KDP operon response regulator KdpE